jgi:predicted cupin superfamily sugar epimerase
MADNLAADEIRALLQLEPNATCGFVRQTYLSALSIAPNGLPAPFADGRPLGSALYFMVTPTAPVRLHRIRNDQLYHYYLGDPIELFLLHADGNAERIVVGPDLRAGQRAATLPGNTFPRRASWAAALGFSRRTGSRASSADVEIGNLDALAGNIRRLPRSCAPSRHRCFRRCIGRRIEDHIQLGGRSSRLRAGVIAALQIESRSMRRQASSVICPSCRVISVFALGFDRSARASAAATASLLSVSFGTCWRGVLARAQRRKDTRPVSPSAASRSSSLCATLRV